MNASFDVLVIEDEAVVAEAVRRILTPEGYAVDVAMNGEEALYKLEKGAYRLVLVDLMLPKITGFELIEIMKRRSIPSAIIVMTGYSSMESAVQSLAMGALDYIPKPFDEDELLAVVRRGLNFPDEDHFDAPDLKSYYTLGKQSWVRLDPEGFATIGASRWFASSVGPPKEIRFPPLHQEIAQGNVCLRAIGADDLPHVLWSPLTGLVLKTNETLEGNPRLFQTDPLREGWLVRVVPTRLKEDLAWLEFH